LLAACPCWRAIPCRAINNAHAQFRIHNSEFPQPPSPQRLALTFDF
jgi:hypothetical protein